MRELHALVTDGLMAQNNCMEACLEENDGRSSALKSVLRALPEDDYAMLKTKKPWILAPNKGVMGWNGRLPSDKLQIIYLSESLEGKTREECKLAIAHEVAHSILGHTDSSSSDVIENEAWQKVVAFGLATQEQINDFRGQHNFLATQS